MPTKRGKDEWAEIRALSDENEKLRKSLLEARGFLEAVIRRIDQDLDPKKADRTKNVVRPDHAQLELGIEVTGLSAQTVKALKAAGIYRVSDITALPLSKIKMLNGFGHQSTVRLLSFLNKHGLSLKNA